MWCTSGCLLKGVLQYSTLTFRALQSHTLRRTALSCLQISAGHFHKAKKSPAFKATGMMTSGQETSPVPVPLRLPTTGELIPEAWQSSVNITQMKCCPHVFVLHTMPQACAYLINVVGAAFLHSLHTMQTVCVMYVFCTICINTAADACCDDVSK